MILALIAVTAFGANRDDDDEQDAGRFVRMFKKLDAYQPPEFALSALAAATQDPNADADDNPRRTPSGFTYLGQFLDHDLTLDVTPLEQANDVNRLLNARTARLDLDSMYGGGPLESPQLYDAADKFRFQQPNGFHDFQRDPITAKAVLVEERNDENLVIAQIHIAFQRFHNRFMDLGHSFEQARILTSRHWQWIVVNEFLPEIVGQETVDRFIRYNGAGKVKFKGDFFKPNKNKPQMPIEFSGAAYRFGHSMVRLAYVMPAGSVTKTQVFNAAANDLRGNRIIPPNLKIDFNNFFDIPGRPVPPGRNISRKIDALVSRSMFALPVGPVVPPNPPQVTSLPERNLLRGARIGIPSYQDVAREMGITPLTNAEMGLTDPALGDECPLWFGILKESELRANSERLGPTGGRIVAEVILALIDADRDSYFHVKDWRPMGSRETWGIADLLAFAGALD